jgi:hypothetical protein
MCADLSRQPTVMLICSIEMTATRRAKSRVTHDNTTHCVGKNQSLTKPIFSPLVQTSASGICFRGTVEDGALALTIMVLVACTDPANDATRGGVG